ncbi:TraU family protein [Paenirhodobacter populi]|uniref:TraU family protein n=1 Tax=Paenirhodobacter populi TaxID=2306993 RepID=UPI0013E33945|nr:TraU family protein [Sinirhodobacter populi]
MLDRFGKQLATSFLALAVMSGVARADGEETVDECPASNMLGSGMVSNICWSCIFPLKVAGITIFGNSQEATGVDGGGFALSSKPAAPSNAASKAICLCDNDALPTVGIPIGMWLPTEVYETTMVPGCSSTLGGVRLGIADKIFLGTAGDPTSDLEQQSFNHIHTFSYPVVTLMDLFTKCAASYQDIDILYMSELDPMWNDPIVALYGNPMSVFGSSVIAQSACAADAISASVGKPVDNLFWCGGSWTSTMAPYTGFEHAQGNVQFTAATSLKLLAMDAARGLARRTVGDDAVCQARYQPMLKRSNYRWQVAWPRAEASRNHASGESILRWGAGRTIPGVAEMPIYLQWQWVDCCATVLGK